MNSIYFLSYFLIINLYKVIKIGMAMEIDTLDGENEEASVVEAGNI